MKEFKLMLAPMEDYTDSVFRELCYKKGADFTFTEMARISGLARNNKSTLKKIEIKNKVPTYIQLIGSNVNKLNKFLENFKPSEGFLGFNFNLGCSSPNIIRSGIGCALIKRITRVKEIVKIIKNHGYNVNIKLRLGLNKYEKENQVYINLIKEIDADFFIVHPRTGKETLNDSADISVYEACVKTGKNIIANGDIKTKEQINYLKSIGIKGAMIGREAIKNPNIFKILK